MVESLVDFGIVMVSCLWFYWRPGVVVVRSRSSVVGDVAALVVSLDDELDGDVLGCVGCLLLTRRTQPISAKAMYRSSGQSTTIADTGGPKRLQCN